MFHVPCFKTVEEINFCFNIILDCFSISTSLSLSLSQSEKTWQSPLQNLKGRRAVWDASSLWLTKYEDLIRAIHTFHNIQFSGRAKPLQISHRRWSYASAGNAMSVNTLTRVQNVSLSLHPSLWSMNPNVANTWIDGCKLVSPIPSQLCASLASLCLTHTWWAFTRFPGLLFFYFWPDAR